MTVRAGLALGEDTTAAHRAIFGLTLAVGLVAAAGSALVGDPLVLIGLPAIVLLAARRVGSVELAGGAAAGVWLLVAFHAEGEALIVPGAMMVGCLAIAAGPDRLARWLEHPADAGATGGETAWIEES